jgi:N-methylhydantoinase A
MRYRGQAFTIEINLPDAMMPAQLAPEILAELFHHRYEELYQNKFLDSAIELINLRVRVVGKRRPLSLRRISRASGPSDKPLPRGTRTILYGRRPHEAAVYDRATLKAEHELPGPALIEQFDTTTVVAPGMVARVDECGLMTLVRRAENVGVAR